MSRHTRPLRRLIGSILFLTAGLAGFAQDDDRVYRFDFDLGYRWRAGFRGSEDLYRSQLDYGEGPKLLSGNFHIQQPEEGRFFEGIDVNFNSWGGEPYNTAHVRAYKGDVYELSFDYLNVHYFNSIPGFANPFFESGVLESQHISDLSEQSGQLLFRLHPGRKLSPFFSFRWGNREGPVRTTLAADGDEFVIGSEADSNSKDFRGGVDLRFDKLTLHLAQGVRLFRDRTVFSATGFQTGNSSRRLFGRDIVLTDHAAQVDTDGTVPFSEATAVYLPHETVALRGHLSYGIATWDSGYQEASQGTFFAFPPSSFFYSGLDLISVGQAKQPSWVAGFSANWRPVDEFEVLERFTTRRFHISSFTAVDLGFDDVDPLLEPGPVDRREENRRLESFLAMDLDTQEILGVVRPRPRVQLRFGHRYQRKRVQTDQSFSWTRNVLLLGGSYDFSPVNRISAEYELGRTDQPIIRLDPVNFHRLRLRGRVSPFRSLRLSANWTLFDHEDDFESIDLTSRTRDFSVRFDYALRDRISISGGYERSTFNHNVLFLVPQTFQTEQSVYRERGDFADVFLSVGLVRNAVLNLGYSAWGTVGNFPLNYHRPMASLEIPLLENLVAYGQWNFYDYREKLQLLPQSYRTHLALFGFRYSWERGPNSGP